jgi:hypothetical protein
MQFREYLAESEFRFEGDSVGIVTAHNPQGKKLSRKQNKKLNGQLWTDLRVAGHDPWAVAGNYQGHKEDSFMIPDISREELVSYAKKYDQAAVIWAKKVDHGYDVEWIADGKTTKRKNIANIRSLLAQSVSF